MKKYLFCLVAFFALYSCQSEDENIVPLGKTSGINTSVDYVKLSDDNSNIAGVLKIYTDAPAVQLKWNTTENCNLDTKVTSVTINNGVGELPINWFAKGENGTFAPADIAFRAGVLITSGKDAKYVPLILADEVDESKLKKVIGATTRAGDGELPKVAEVKILPKSLNLNQSKGGIMSVRLNGVDFVIVDYSNLNDAMQLDMDALPGAITDPTTLLNFNWKPSAPSTGFTAEISFIADELTEKAIISYIPGGLGELEIAEVTEKIPADGGDRIASTIVVTTEANWTATSNQPWLTLEPSTGVYGSSTLYINAEPNLYTGERVATVTVKSGVLTKSITVTQLGTAPAPTLNYVSSTPEGNLPYSQTTYTATFTGTYTGNVAIRVSSNGIVLNTGSMTQYPTTQPSVIVPANTGTASRPLTFEYSTNGTEWISLPATASRIQNGSASSTVNPDNNTGVNDWGNGGNINGGQIQL